MNLNDLSINWNEVTEIGFKPLPPGNYAAKITSSELKPTKNKEGQMIKMVFTLVGKKGVKGRQIFENFNVKNSSEQAVQIGLGKLKKMLTVLKQDPNAVYELNELNGTLIGLNLKIKSSPGYDDTNEIKDFIEFSEELLETSADSNDSSF